MGWFDHLHPRIERLAVCTTEIFFCLEYYFVCLSGNWVSPLLLGLF